MMAGLPIELIMLFGATVLYVLQILFSALLADLQNGIAWGLGNREHIPEMKDWRGRAQRAYMNMAENLLPFACLILIAYSSGRVGEWSALGAEIFVISRILYALFYTAGITVLRSVAYFGGLIGMLLIGIQILS